MIGPDRVWGVPGLSKSGELGLGGATRLVVWNDFEDDATLDGEGS